MLTQKFLQECFDYDKNTGILRWKTSRPTLHFKDNRGRVMFENRCAGRQVGTKLPNGQLSCLNIKGKVYKVHRIIWQLVYGDLDTRWIDHIDGNAQNNKLSNLRKATPQENCRNRKVNSKLKSGLKGAKWNATKEMWYSTIRVGHTVKWLGYFDTANAAHEAFTKEAKKLHGEFYREN